MGFIAALAPDFLDSLRSVDELDLVKHTQTAISGIYTAAVAFIFSWRKRENVYKMVDPNKYNIIPKGEGHGP